MSNAVQEQMREAEVRRRTKETDVRVRLVLDGGGASQVSTGVAFLDHMLSADLLRAKAARADPSADRLWVAAHAARSFGNSEHVVRYYNITVDASIRFAETPLAAQSILQYAPNSPGAKSYRALATAILKAGAAEIPGRAVRPRERVRAAKS